MRLTKASYPRAPNTVKSPLSTEEVTELRKRIEKFYKNKPARYSSTVVGISTATGVAMSKVVETLWFMWGLGLVERTIRGRWFLKSKLEPLEPLTEDEKKVFLAVREANPNITLSILAARAGVDRSRMRELLDALLKKEALLERGDGWYKTNIKVE